MKPAGQRQDVAFLALAVAVLAIAVALFVGLRTLSGMKAARPASPAPASQAQQRPSPAPRPPGSKDHDPFRGKPVPAQPDSGQTQAKPAEQLRLVGVVQGQGRSLLAAIRGGDRRYYAKRGDMVSGYTVADITTKRVVLVKGEERLTLHLGSERPAVSSGQGERPGAAR